MTAAAVVLVLAVGVVLARRRRQGIDQRTWQRAVEPLWRKGHE